MTKDELIAALEAATGPSFVLDLSIAFYVRPADIAQTLGPRPYTASIDAAMTLVPERWQWVLDGGDTPSRACLLDRGERCVDVTGATPAIALCIAALRAHA